MPPLSSPHGSRGGDGFQSAGNTPAPNGGGFTPLSGQVSAGGRSAPMNVGGGGLTQMTNPALGSGQFNPATVPGAMQGTSPAWLSQVPAPLQAFYLSQWKANPGMAPPPMAMQGQSLGNTPVMQSAQSFGGAPPISNQRNMGNGR